jgi:hypothetical protein
MLRGALSRLDRGVSVALAIVWLVIGVVGLVAGAIHSSFRCLSFLCSSPPGVSFGLRSHGAAVCSARLPAVCPVGGEGESSRQHERSGVSCGYASTLRRNPCLTRMKSRSFPHSARGVPTGARALGAFATGALAGGGFALGAMAVGAVAIGAVAVGRLVVGRARIRRLQIDELSVGRLLITEELRAPQLAASGRVMQPPVEDTSPLNPPL